MDTDILSLDLQFVERNNLHRKQKYEYCSMDGPWPLDLGIELKYNISKKESISGVG